MFAGRFNAWFGLRTRQPNAVIENRLSNVNFGGTLFGKQLPSVYLKPQRRAQREERAGDLPRFDGVVNTVMKAGALPTRIVRSPSNA